MNWRFYSSCAVEPFFGINSGFNSFFFSGVVIGNPVSSGIKSRGYSTGFSLAAVCGQHTSFPRQWVSMKWHLFAVVVYLAPSVVIYRRAASQGVRHQLMESEDGVTAELAQEGWKEHHQLVVAEAEMAAPLRPEGVKKNVASM